MNLSTHLRKRGFRRWYERQLFESHAYLVTAFLSLILVATAAEVYPADDTAVRKIIVLAIAAGAAVLGLYAWRRFGALLLRAETLAAQATCRSCRAYGKFDVVGALCVPESPGVERVNVRCRRCCREWVLE